MKIHWFFKNKEVPSTAEMIDKLGEQDDLSQLVNFFEETLKFHPSVMGSILQAPSILVIIMNRIHVIFNHQKENNANLKGVEDQEEELWCKPWHKYPSYNAMKTYLDFLKTVITPSKDILLTANDDESDEDYGLKIF
jgi:hypothetical protein